MTKPDDAAVTDQAEYWVVRLASGEIEGGELAAFKAWQAAAPEHRAAFDRERALWQMLEGREAAFAPAPAVRRRPVRPWACRITPPRALAAAAAAALVALAPGAMLRLEADAIAATGEIRTVKLADGSTAMLDSDAAIAIRFDDAERRVELLRGQAWFDVRHGDRRPFRVTALDGVTQDIGTSFEVSHGEDEVTVAVTQGEVQVSARHAANAVALTALARARYGLDGTVERLPSAAANSIAPWRRGLIVIDGRSVDEAIAEVARYRAGPTFTWADTSAHPPVSGVFRIDAPDEALRTLAQIAGLRIATLPGGVAILRR